MSCASAICACAIDDSWKPHGVLIGLLCTPTTYHTLNGSSGQLLNNIIDSANLVKGKGISDRISLYNSCNQKSGRRKMAFAMTDKLGALKQVSMDSVKIINRISYYLRALVIR